MITLDPTDPNPINICQPNPPTTTSCYQEAWTLSGQPDGTVIFVYTDCTTRAPLSPDKQDPAYNQPGVALPGGAAIQMQIPWANDTCSVTPRAVSGSTDEFVNFDIKDRAMIWGPIGDFGDRLRDMLAACGNGNLSSVAWNFTWTPFDPDFEFVAVGTNLDPSSGLNSAPNCIGNVVVSVGGPNKDGCQGYN